MNYEVVADREFPNYWRVEAIDSKTGDVYIAVFYGPDAKIRAEEYSGLKQRTEALEQRAEKAERERDEYRDKLNGVRKMLLSIVSGAETTEAFGEACSICRPSPEHRHEEGCPILAAERYFTPPKELEESRENG